MHPLAQKVSSLRRQLVLRQRAAAACWTAATVLAAAIALGTADYLVRFADPGLRIMATFALVSAALWAVYRWWYVPSRNQLASLAVARRVEAHFPQLRDMLASSMEFLEQSEDDRTAGSAQLRRLVVAEAQSAVERLPLDDVIDRGPLRRAVKWLAAPVIVLMVMLAFDASAVGTAVTRLVAPLGSTQWPRTHHLAFRNVPKRMAAGQTFEVELIDTAGPLPDDVRIEYRMADRASRESTNEPMTRAGEAMLARRENVRQSFAFRAVGGDDHTMPWHWVEVVEPPRLEAFSVIAHPPAYTGLPSASAEGHLEVLAGSGLEVRGASNESLSAGAHFDRKCVTYRRDNRRRRGQRRSTHVSNWSGTVDRQRKWPLPRGIVGFGWHRQRRRAVESSRAAGPAAERFVDATDGRSVRHCRRGSANRSLGDG